LEGSCYGWCQGLNLTLHPYPNPSPAPDPNPNANPNPDQGLAGLEKEVNAHGTEEDCDCLRVTGWQKLSGRV